MKLRFVAKLIFHITGVSVLLTSATMMAIVSFVQITSSNNSIRFHEYSATIRNVEMTLQVLGIIYGIYLFIQLPKLFPKKAHQ
jgi:hypothetical protein